MYLGLGKGPTVYVLSELRASSVEHFIPSPTRFTPSGLSLNWHAGPSGSWELASSCEVQHGTAEATLAATGRKAGCEPHAIVSECLVHRDIATLSLAFLAHHVVCSLGLPTEVPGKSVTLSASLFNFCSSSAEAEMSVTSCTLVS